MAMVSLVIIAIFTKLLISSTKNTDLITANLLARGIMDKAVRQGPPKWGKDDTYSISGGSASLATNGDQSDTKFVYEIETRKVTSNPDSVGQLFWVKVTVSWWADKVGNKNSRQDYGRLSTEIVRTVYLRGT